MSGRSPLPRFAPRSGAISPVALGAALWVAAVGPAFAAGQIAPRPTAYALAGRVVEVEVPAPALEGNLLDTPTVQGAAVYLPPGYERETARRYPVIYLLHGWRPDQTEARRSATAALR